MNGEYWHNSSNHFDYYDCILYCKKISSRKNTMEKTYEFKVLAQMAKTHTTTSMYIFVARNEREARNMFKASFPNAYKIVSCVRGCERTKPQIKQPASSSNSNAVGTVLLGAAAVGGFIFSKLLGSKK